jgi:hypothetical protein
MSPDAPSNAKERASLFLTQVTRSRTVWGLRNKAGGLATWAFEESEETLIPFWSGKEEARLCAEVSFPDYTAFEMSVEYFTGSVLPQLAKKGILVGVNLSDKMGGVDLPAADLIAEIQRAGN